MSSEPAIELQNVSRSYGSVRAVTDLSFSIAENSVVGFIGANGSGKTTTMRMISTLEFPERGSIRVKGLDVLEYPDKVRQLVGWMPDAFGTYPNMDVIDYLDFFARAARLTGATRRNRIAEILDFTGLDRLASRPCNKLSKGETQRLGLGRMPISDPDVLILDEPAAGLDPRARLEFKNLVRILKDLKKTLFISSHILSELGEMCDSLIFIAHGHLRFDGRTHDLLNEKKEEALIRIGITGDLDDLTAWVGRRQDLKIVERLEDGVRAALQLAAGESPPAAMQGLLKDLLSAGFGVFEFHAEKRKLEDAFIDLLRIPAPPLP